MVEQTIPGADEKLYISVDDYMDKYAEHYFEWVNGELIKNMPGTLLHTLLIAFVAKLLDAYFAFNGGGGRVIQQPFVMRLDSIPARREPDIQVVLNTNPGQLTETYMHGAADLCVEIVSPESGERDYVEKVDEYQAAGVREYWIFDPQRKFHRFYRLNERGLYDLVHPDTDGVYSTPLLPKFRLYVSTLWSDPLPDFIGIYRLTQAMFADAEN